MNIDKNRVNHSLDPFFSLKYNENTYVGLGYKILYHKVPAIDGKHYDEHIDFLLIGMKDCGMIS